MNNHLYSNLSICFFYFCPTIKHTDFGTIKKLKQQMNEQPPVFKTWTTWYWLVLGVMIIQVLLFSFLTNSF